MDKPHKTMLKFLITRLKDRLIKRELLSEFAKFLHMNTVFLNVLFVVNHRYKAVLLDLDNFKAAGELSVLGIEDMSHVILQVLE